MNRKPYGEQWNGKKGYRVIEGNDNYNHFFGTLECEVPICKLCRKEMHLIFTFDLNDERLSDLKTKDIDILPLASCLNCSMVWQPQYFQICNRGKTLKIIKQENIEEWISDDEDKLPVPLPKTNIKLLSMKSEDIPTTEDNYNLAFDSFGSEYLCRILGAPLYDDFPEDSSCPFCKSKMKYIATITQDYGEQELISVVDFQLGEFNILYYLCKSCLILKTEAQVS